MMTIEQWMIDIQRGVNWGGRLRIRWQSKGRRFAIVTVSGHRGWQCRGSQCYYPAKHYIVDLAKSAGERGLALQRNTTIKELTGKLTTTIIAAEAKGLS